MRNLQKIVLALFASIIPNISFAHSFGTVYTLPIPAWMYVYSGGVVVLFSFLVISFFIKDRSSIFKVKEMVLSGNFFENLGKQKSKSVISNLSFIIFIFAIASGIFGVNASNDNFNMNYFWIFFVLGVTYLSAVFGNIYSYLNPWENIANGLPERFKKGLRNYPNWLGYFPALIFYVIFVWIELFSGVTPLSLSKILIDYTIINFVGMFLFGIKSWFKYCEFFSVLFGLISECSIITYKDDKFIFRYPFSNLINTQIEKFSLLLFTIFILSSTAYDGLQETEILLVNYVIYFDDFFSLIFGAYALKYFHTFNLLFLLFAFTSLYLFFIYLTQQITRSKESLKYLSLAFVPSLIPIALVYNVAHYFTLILTEAPKMLSQISDPLGLGWNIFGTASWKINYIPDTFYVWHFQVFFILVGHIVAVYIAHIIAIKVFGNRKQAILSQIPMLVLMVFYTMFGLWILSLPITG